MQSKAATVQQYLAELPSDRRAAVQAVREVILKNLDKRGYAEGIQYGMIGYFVPHSVFPAGYHCDPRQPLPFAALASQKNYMALYLMSAYGDAGEGAWLREAWAKTGKKLDMGKSCIRFKKLEDVPLEVIGEAIRRVPAKAYIASYEAMVPTATRTGGAKAAKAAAAAADAAGKKAASKRVTAKVASKKVASKKVTAKAGKKVAARKTAKRA
jgi:hypothetical protein